jgi:hypothetical protein
VAAPAPDARVHAARYRRLGTVLARRASLGACVADLAGGWLLALHVADKRVRYAMSTRRPTCEPEHLAIQFTSVPHALNTSDRLFCTTCKRKNRGTQSTRAAGDDT